MVAAMMTKIVGDATIVPVMVAVVEETIAGGATTAAMMTVRKRVRVKRRGGDRPRLRRLMRKMAGESLPILLHAAAAETAMAVKRNSLGAGVEAVASVMLRMKTIPGRSEPPRDVILSLRMTKQMMMTS